MRIDKYLSQMGADSRSDVKKNLRKGLVFVNGEVIKDAATSVDETAVVVYKGVEYTYSKYQYFMLNKPAGIVSATTDNKETTVVDLFKGVGRKDLFPVGRLDKDTVGLLIVTNDGAMAHRLLSPTKHVEKVYYAKVDGLLSDEDVKAFLEGIKIDEDFTALPAKLKICDDNRSAFVTVYEGKFHQIKRMFEARGKKVIYLKRESMANLKLDETLKEGEFRELTLDEIHMLGGSSE